MGKEKKAELIHKSLSVLPGLEDPECIANANKALARRDEADYACFMLLRGLLGACSAARAYEEIYGDDVECAETFVEEALETIKDRQQANHDFMEAVAGRKP